MLKLPEQKFKTTMINSPRALMDEVNNIQEQPDNVSREMEIRRRDYKEMIDSNRNF